MLDHGVEVRINRAVVEHDVTADRRPGLPARGRRVLRRQQVPVPRRLGPGADRRLALARRAHHQRRDHRHPWHHAGPRADRRGRLAGARRAVRVLRGGAVRVRRPARGRLRRPAVGLGGGRRRRGRDARPLPRRAGAARAVADPAKYQDMWTGAKGFYKVEPIVADGGQVVIYAPHIREVSRDAPAHRRDRLPLPRLLRRSQWDRFKDVPWGDLAHSTHLRGAGTYDPVDGERLRVTVTLATGIPEDAGPGDQPRLPRPGARSIPTRWAADPDTLVVPTGRRGPVPAPLTDPRPSQETGSRRPRPFPAR